MSDPILLPEFPLGTEFEDFIAAHLQCDGLYVERNLIERDVEEVLELDIITTSYKDIIPNVKLYEIKSGGWGFSEIFKIKGWLSYTNIEEGFLVIKEVKKNNDFYSSKAAELGVKLIVVGEKKEKEDALSLIADHSCISEIDISAWRYAFWLERELIKYLKTLKKNSPTVAGFNIVDKYYQCIKGGIFFLSNTSERLDKLYDLYKLYPNISGRCGNEMIGGDFNDEKSVIPKKVFEATFYNCERNLIQVSTLVEYISRLTILKNAVDFYLFEKAGDIRGDKIVFQIGDQKLSMLSFLPQSFRVGIDDLSKHKYFRNYPIFWQWFIYIFGGLIIEDYKESEYRLLSEKTGIPIDEIDNALNVFDVLFPTEGGWFTKTSNSNIKLLKAFPMPFRGIGVNYRREIYLGEDGKYNQLKLTGKYTLKDIVKWNNLAYQILESG